MSVGNGRELYFIMVMEDSMGRGLDYQIELIELLGLYIMDPSRMNYMYFMSVIIGSVLIPITYF